MKITELTEIELIYLAEELICILDCRARNDNEYATPDDLVEENLRKTPIVLDLIGWHEDAKILRNITLENITEYKKFLYDLEWKCLPYTNDAVADGVRIDLFTNKDTVFEFCGDKT